MKYFKMGIFVLLLACNTWADCLESTDCSPGEIFVSGECFDIDA
jgi:hypothetical protein